MYCCRYCGGSCSWAGAWLAGRPRYTVAPASACPMAQGTNHQQCSRTSCGMYLSRQRLRASCGLRYLYRFDTPPRSDRGVHLPANRDMDTMKAALCSRVGADCARPYSPLKPRSCMGVAKVSRSVCLVRAPAMRPCLAMLCVNVESPVLRRSCIQRSEVARWRMLPNPRHLQTPYGSRCICE